MKLSALKIQKLSKVGRHSDGRGLYLYVKPGGGKSWVFRYTAKEKRRDMGLGSFPALSLADARVMVAKYHERIAHGLDPLEVRELESAREVITFEHCLMDYVASQRAGWKTDKQAADIVASFRNHAPKFLKLPVADIGFDDVVGVLAPLWGDKTETASRIQTRMEAVLGLARVRGYRTGDNPAAWKGNLSFKFKRREAVQPIKHFRAMPRDELPAFFAFLSRYKHTSYQALRFIILTAARTDQALGAQWSEIDMERRVWTIPCDRMKSGREHRVPLTEPALEILRDLRSWVDGRWVFQSVKNWDGHISNMACLEIMREHDRKEHVHGFRSTFKDWAAECTDYPNEVSEMALSHAVGSRTEAAYRRGDLLEKRRELMRDWADFCTSAMRLTLVAAQS